MGNVLSQKTSKETASPFHDRDSEYAQKSKLRPERTLNDNCTRHEMKGNQETFSPKNKNCTEVYEMKRDRIGTRDRESTFPRDYSRFQALDP